MVLVCRLYGQKKVADLTWWKIWIESLFLERWRKIWPDLGRFIAVVAELLVFGFINYQTL
ncbi:hypothetical protein HanRHA438_Chr09g0423131 [Helianthus annuus]|nr:hypothetical protein HanIR_Chr09g0442971 [Helianthus annuus]KAJ0713101.1 hypothetical protein HanOQP8_Chr09g0342021 [Helianthus annuus]KAJ0725990.1 hypothetical protein HanPI659440_Chr12g0465191 [Helianthus annuus]KAJ0890382.1 hypothetical protein HanRHA438_Chr09g0423131 [Helianthus annuus]KAJ0895138.1 hypothetical protein HanPSC8_Chr09g0396991 [Helianthus annuus]